MKVRICCDTMREALANDDLEQDSEMNAVTIIRGGDPISFCPWCGNRIFIRPTKDVERT